MYLDGYMQAPVWRWVWRRSLGLSDPSGRPPARTSKARDFSPAEQVRSDRVRALNPYRTAPAALQRPGAPRRAPPAPPRYTFQLNLPADMRGLQRLLMSAHTAHVFQLVATAQQLVMDAQFHIAADF